MGRLIFVPQFPTRLRYQETWFEEFPKQFKKEFDEVIVLGDNYLKQFEDPIRSSGMFAPIENSIYFEENQIIDFLKLKLYNDDTLFLSDLSFPGLFANILYHKPIKNSFAYCHATSLNRFDYFQPVRKLKYSCELSHSKLFKKIFIGSYYHQRKLVNKNRKFWYNTKVIGLPIPPYETYREKKYYDIISVARPNPQKITKSIEKEVEKDFSKIIRIKCNTWEQYYKFLSQAKILLITSKEDTFNYSIMEAVMNGTVVLAPNRLAFPELLPREFLYDNYDELAVKIWQNLKDNKPLEKLLCQDRCEDFYKNIISEMI